MNGGMESVVRALETDLRKAVDAYVTADIKDDQLSVSIVTNGTGWRLFIDDLDGKVSAGISRSTLFDFVFGKYLEYCFEDIVRNT